MIRVAIQGAAGSFHSISSKNMFDEERFQLVYCERFDQVFEKVRSGAVDAAVVAIENSLFGSINQVFQLLDLIDWRVLAEDYLRIEHCLIGVKGAEIDRLKAIKSQGVAIAQCSDFIQTRLSPDVLRVETDDTAGAVREVVEEGDVTVAAIASADAAVEFGGVILERGVETNKKNFTRFFVISVPEKCAKVRQALMQKSEPVSKATYVLRTNHSSGALAAALQVFSGMGCNLTKIESRPIVGEPNRYKFYIDSVLNGADTVHLEQEIGSLGFEIVHRGTYAAGEPA